MLQGAVAHPGYGREKVGDNWVPKEDVRLYFVVAMSVRTASHCVKAMKLPSCNFYRCGAKPAPNEVPSNGYLYLGVVFSETTWLRIIPGLAYFRNLSE